MPKVNEIPKQGHGQRIESNMAQDVGIKIFRISCPMLLGSEEIDNNATTSSSNMIETDFKAEDIDVLIAEIQKWYDGNCSDTRVCNLSFLLRAGEESEGEREAQVSFRWV